MYRAFFPVLVFLMMLNSCTPKKDEATPEFRLVTLDPGHFHAALIQKTVYLGVDSTVHVYAPEGSDVQLHLARINGYNTRPDAPANWNEVVYIGNDFLDRMLREKKGNVVVLAGNNRKKSEYIHQCIKAGFHVLADKPMAITGEGFERLKASFAAAKKNNVLLYDIMTERYEITSMLQKEFSLQPELFGQLETGTKENPAVIKESVHYFYKYVSGNVLTRPSWFFDVREEGEGMVDVTTHLVDLVQWACFPEQVLNYETDIRVLGARRWPTDLTLQEFGAVTKLDAFPDELRRDVKDSVLRVYSNGEIDYTIKGVHARVSVTWGYKAPEGAGDSHYSIMRGSKCNLVIRQGKEQAFRPALFIEPLQGGPVADSVVRDVVADVARKFPGISITDRGGNWEVIIPDEYKEGHEAHFARVAEKFFQYARNGSIPEWEVPNMIAKYYTTTTALETARRNEKASGNP
jgi:predicted dehydrogenase